MKKALFPFFQKLFHMPSCYSLQFAVSLFLLFYFVVLVSIRAATVNAYHLKMFSFATTVTFRFLNIPYIKINQNKKDLFYPPLLLYLSKD